MSKQLHPMIIAALVVVLVVAAGGALYYFSGPSQPGANYTPGVPPWKEPGAKGYNPNGNYGPKYHTNSGPAAPPSTPAS